jgi:hypothetical protein
LNSARAEPVTRKSITAARTGTNIEESKSLFQPSLDHEIAASRVGLLSSPTRSILVNVTFLTPGQLQLNDVVSLSVVGNTPPCRVRVYVCSVSVTVRDTVTGYEEIYYKSRQGGVFPTTERDSTTFSCN